MKKRMNFFKTIKTGILTIIMCIVYSLPLYADSIQGIKLYQGTMNLLRDATSIALVVLPTVVGLLLIYFNIRKSACEQQEQQVWSKRMKTAIIALVIGETASSIVTLITSYYSG